MLDGAARTTIFAVTCGRRGGAGRTEDMEDGEMSSFAKAVVVLGAFVVLAAVVAGCENEQRPVRKGDFDTTFCLKTETYLPNNHPLIIEQNKRLAEMRKRGELPPVPGEMPGEPMEKPAAEPEKAPAEPEKAPAEPEKAPAEPEKAPAEPEKAPAEPEMAPAPAADEE